MQDADGYWGSTEGGYEIALLDLDTAKFEIEVPGAWSMPVIQSLTVMDYVPPDFPRWDLSRFTDPCGLRIFGPHDEPPSRRADRRERDSARPVPRVRYRQFDIRNTAREGDQR
ncbi:hypothetical protein C3B59_03905 [Cryobacterium zongtaii]|uniref:Uncharacterized protein n=1 Tax=Cryobacterium zongtaii TaxID=1259217 RepID=A0A2S3ZPM1_9MICO|nr:hypothetical protein [Cryobacterium zongtaii]POH70820.1 hypothetical protein C3B59_03905 [Cryobacterium zongtaii]